MSADGRLWEPVNLYDGGLDLRICEATTALQVTRDLLPSRPVEKRAFARGQLSCNGTALSPVDRLEEGTTVALAFWPQVPPDAQALETASGGKAADILHRDPVLLAANKPAGVLVHGDGTDAPTLMAQVQVALGQLGSHGVARPVQRLDVDTTGVVLFSLTEEFQPALDALVAGHEMRKRYLAVVEGVLPGGPCDGEGWHVLDGPIARDRHNPRRMRVGRTGKPARTRVRALAEHEGLSLVLAELETGRRHQIRVHLAHAGCPIVGDALYGDGGRRSSDGLMLHAWQESFDHPITAERVCVEAPVPDRFRTLFPQVDDLLNSLI